MNTVTASGDEGTYGTVAYFVGFLRKARSRSSLNARILGSLDDLVTAESKDIVQQLRNLLEAERIVAAERHSRPAS